MIAAQMSVVSKLEARSRRCDIQRNCACYSRKSAFLFSSSFPYYGDLVRSSVPQCYAFEVKSRNRVLYARICVHSWFCEQLIDYLISESEYQAAIRGL